MTLYVGRLTGQIPGHPDVRPGARDLLGFVPYYFWTVLNLWNFPRFPSAAPHPNTILINEQVSWPPSRCRFDQGYCLSAMINCMGWRGVPPLLALASTMG